MKPGIVTIRPGQHEGGGPCLTMGTKVLMPDGTEMPGVHKVVLTADVNDVWKAEIHCYASLEEIRAEAIVKRTTVADDTSWPGCEVVVEGLSPVPVVTQRITVDGVDSRTVGSGSV